ncbi:MAG: NADH-quinone oxidoreductase subunit M [Armatimonadetes bacterium CG2_30_59_28]|nr:NADH-quinone oxidoreductase subunit M [Armatimonadota bacterium]OIO91638.1 MAG: NADH-quinone oxidoreductase subunit M [Armatimonadetes bacterium CG2_30_59_28]PIU61997.1 MAG: NADH-quinone oxidoreductase subunit M [Armatimonadetes bacterium CG07_land_8_20_14_0_80_59_28]PIX45836.1 MAG: NADH-quinone oxidoreductase subunit M [Armatimonadetes bacterium CG_4_8_14_3_um_filter_58_9]
MNEYILSLIVFLPLLAALVLLFIDSKRAELIRAVGLVVALMTFVLSLSLPHHFVQGQKGFQFECLLLWIPQFSINYHVGIDGISLLLILLTTFITPLVLLASWTDIKDKVKAYIVCMLLLETGMIGVFVSLDLILFYVFWEAMLIPMYFLIGIWGGPRRVYAAVKFFIYTMVGSVLMLVAILVLYFAAQPEHTFDLIALTEIHPLTGWLGLIAFGAFALAFAIKVPMFPFHTWLPDAHVEAPTAGSVILAAVLLKMGTYGFLRFCLPLFPEASIACAPIISALAIIGIIYGALVAMAQTDIKKLVAYSSVSHLGFVMLGIFAFNMQGMSGSLLQMLNHGLSTGALFLIVGMIYERRHTRQIADFGGIARVVPVLTVCFLLATLSSIGLPGLNGFVGEFLILLGTFQVNPTYAIFATFGIVLGAAYMLRMFRSVMYGPLDKEENASLKDLNAREIAVLVPVILCMFWIGLYPKWFLSTMDASIQEVQGIVLRADHEGSNTTRQPLSGPAAPEVGPGGSFPVAVPPAPETGEPIAHLAPDDTSPPNATQDEGVGHRHRDATTNRIGEVTP